ncbi:MAG: AAA family ATPase [Cyclobacteriaceae bacterium]
MIRKVEIDNYKSLNNLEINLGRLNVLIGENGCGKSNILEAIGFGGAASANQLKKESLVSRGIRVSRPDLMRSGFSKDSIKEEILLKFEIVKDPNELINSNQIISFRLQNHNQAYSDWFDQEKDDITKGIRTKLPELIFNDKSELLDQIDEEGQQSIKTLKQVFSLIPKEEVEGIFSNKPFLKFIENFYEKDNYNKLLAEYRLYSPENSSLRKFEDEEKIQPLGIKGEGLFKLIKVFTENTDKSTLDTLKKYLRIIDWFEDFNLSASQFENEKVIELRDRFIKNQIQIQQDNANEGFLFLLFYLSLFLSEDTPRFFAIDNVEASFNPKLCVELIRIFNELSQSQGKQVLLSTHNPFILDGLDLKDDDQRLFVVRRNREGQTLVKRILPNNGETKLSEAWMLGYFGGLPKNF